MNSIRLALTAAILVGLALSAGCSSKAPPLPSLANEAVSESRWSAALTSGGESIPLTIIALIAPDLGQTRLVALSAFGVTLGDCRLEKGRNPCRSAPGADGLMKRISTAFGEMLRQDASFLLEAGSDSARLTGSGWQAERDSSGKIEYRRTKAAIWTLSLKRLPGK